MLTYNARSLAHSALGVMITAEQEIEKGNFAVLDDALYVHDVYMRGAINPHIDAHSSEVFYAVQRFEKIALYASRRMENVTLAEHWYYWNYIWALAMQKAINTRNYAPRLTDYTREYNTKQSHFYGASAAKHAASYKRTKGTGIIVI